eukprot:scaffold194191_cov46-Prasinocladus_malaysianus.AAC.1
MSCCLIANRKDGDKKDDYSAVSSRKYSTVQGTPVAEMGDEYTKDTFALAQNISSFVQMVRFLIPLSNLFIMGPGSRIRLDASLCH